MARLEPIEYLFAALYAEAFPIKASGFTTGGRLVLRVKQGLSAGHMSEMTTYS